MAVCLCVHPGDPFPVDEKARQVLTSEDLINANELQDRDANENLLRVKSPNVLSVPNDDDETPSSLVTTQPTSTKSTTTLKLFSKSTATIKTLHKKNDDKKVQVETIKNHDHQLSPVTKLRSVTFSPMDKIRIGRWKFEDLQTKETRYWYEPEGGHMGTGWMFDGFVFQAYNRSETNTEPVYAFHSEIRSVWTNTVQMDPRPPTIGYDQWIPDGVTFYAYRTMVDSLGLQPVIRYWNKLKDGATDETQTRITYLVMKSDESSFEERSGWTLDKVLFYACPIDA